MLKIQISKLQAELAAAKNELETAYDVYAEKITKLQGRVANDVTIRKMCYAIIAYNKDRGENNEQFLVRRDMFLKIKDALTESEGR